MSWQVKKAIDTCGLSYPAAAKMVDEPEQVRYNLLGLETVLDSAYYGYLIEGLRRIVL